MGQSGMKFKTGLSSIAGLIGAILAVQMMVAPAIADPLKIVALGDSLTAGYGLPPGEAFPDRLEAALKADGHEVEIVNAGVSGDTASGGLARLDWSLPGDAGAVILELGANDALRGVPPAATEKALGAILGKLKARGVPVLLAGMLAPPNMGAEYGARFDAIFPRLAEEYGALYYPFFLDGVAADTALNLADGLHPNKKGIAVIVGRILPYVEKLIDRAGGRT